jgi:excisionase family DNA binding protein
VDETLMDLEQAAEILNCSPRLVRTLVARKELSHVRVGRAIRFRRVDLDEYIEAHVHEAR